MGPMASFPQWLHGLLPLGEETPLSPNTRPRRGLNGTLAQLERILTAGLKLAVFITVVVHVEPTAHQQFLRLFNRSDPFLHSVPPPRVGGSVALAGVAPQVLPGYALHPHLQCSLVFSCTEPIKTEPKTQPLQPTPGDR